MIDPEWPDLDGHTVAAEVVMLRAAENKAILMLEGETDERLMNRFVDCSLCNIVVAHTRDNALTAMDELDGIGLSGVLCIVDTDYDPFLGKTHLNTNIVQTGEHDLEIVLIRSPALEATITEHGSLGKLRALQQGGIDVRDIVLESIYVLGALRLFSIQNGLGLRFAELDFDFLDKRTLKSNDAAMCRQVFNHSQLPGADTKAALAFVQAWKKSHPNDWRVCNGHDYCHALSRGMKSLIGSKSGAKFSREDKILN